MNNIIDIDATLDVISQNSKLKGDFVFGDFARINGAIEGNIKSHGTITIGESAILDTNIDGINIIVKGTIKGDITASNFISIGASARVTGNINTPKLSIENGAYIDGKISMLNYHKELTLTNFFD